MLRENFLDTDDDTMLESLTAMHNRLKTLKDYADAGS